MRKCLVATLAVIGASLVPVSAANAAIQLHITATDGTLDNPSGGIFLRGAITGCPARFEYVANAAVAERLGTHVAQGFGGTNVLKCTIGPEHFRFFIFPEGDFAFQPGSARAVLDLDTFDPRSGEEFFVENTNVFSIHR